MDQKQRQDFKEAVYDVAKVLQFENWLRFYFIKEEGSTLVMRIPDQAMEQIRGKHEDLADLAGMINNEEMDYEKSFTTVCEFVASRLDGSKYEPGVCTSVFESQPFKLEMQLFNLWIQAHENQLDETFFDFETWSTMFWDWKRSGEVKRYLDENKDALLKPQPPKDAPIQ